MPSTYAPTPPTSYPSSAPVVSVPLPIDSDPANAESVNAAFRSMADVLVVLNSLAAVKNTENPQHGSLFLEGSVCGWAGLATYGDLNIAPSDTDALNDWKQIGYFPGIGGFGHLRLYAQYSLFGVSLHLVQNASCNQNASVWTRDNTGKCAAIVSIHPTGVVQFSTWQIGQSGFRNTVYVTDQGMHPTITLNDGRLYVENAAAGTGKSNPPASEPLLNELRAKTMPKAWAVIEFTGGVYVVRNGANIASVTVSGSDMLVTFAQPMANAYYAPNVIQGDDSVSNTVATIFKVHTKTTASFKVRAIDLFKSGSADLDAAGAAQIARSAPGGTLLLSVFGEQ